ncbi:MAG: hypothetical protein B2I17_04800 [Thermoplasmatales archaeon B_DKE]|nr:MAG: hypothetical protein B2I17_04800 [Thermoplasmatales archaeon B_DKE]
MRNRTIPKSSSFGAEIAVSSDELQVVKRQYGKLIINANRRTRIYYSPDCKLVKPEKSRVVTFRSSSEAEMAGYRLCNHCKSEEQRKQENLETISEICDYLKDHYSEKVTLSILGARFHISPHRIHAMFNRTIGISPRKYMDEYRITKLKEKLSSGDSVTAAVYGVGHSSLSWLYTNSRSRLGMTPSKYRHGGAGEVISYVVGHTDFGEMVVAYTDHGICGVSLADSEEMIMKYLKREFQKATLVQVEDTNNYIKGILGYLNGKRVDIPLDLHGTEFQVKVWSALKNIPHGTTVTYSDLAEMIEMPKAVRAVANACGRNPVPLIVPCHRVIRKSGELGGYGLGIDTKRKLLELEKRTKSTSDIND